MWSRQTLPVLALSVVLAACDYRADVERGTVTVRSGETVEVCMDNTIVPQMSGYLDLATLPGLTREDFEGLGIPREEWLYTKDQSVRGISFGDNHSYNPAGFHQNPMRGCWTNGDPRKAGLRRYSLHLYGDPDKVYHKGLGFVMYDIFFDGPKAVYIEAENVDANK